MQYITIDLFFSYRYVYVYLLYIEMKLVVRFSEDIGLSPLEREVNPGETIQNLQILISLNYDKMAECKLIYQGQPLKNKNALVRDVINLDISNEILVSRKNEIQDAVNKLGTMVELFQQNPMAFAGAVVVLLFLILFLMGSS